METPQQHIYTRLQNALKNGMLIMPTGTKSIRELNISDTGRIEFRTISLDEHNEQLFRIEPSPIQLDVEEVFDMKIASVGGLAELKGVTEKQLHDYFFDGAPEND